MDRLFLDANILFSASWREDAALLRLWKLEGIELISSPYAVEEARRNLPEAEQRRRLGAILSKTTLVEETAPRELGADIRLPEKDQPILAAASACGATHLLTGDFKHFGPYFGTRLLGVMVLPPGDYLRSR